MQCRSHTRELFAVLQPATTAPVRSSISAPTQRHRAVAARAVNNMLAGLRGLMGGQVCVVETLEVD